MIRRISFILANYIYKKEKTTHAERYGYYYVILLIISQMYEVSLILLISALLGLFKEVIFCILGFMTFRTKFNGFHATKLRNCCILSTTLLVICGLFSKYINSFCGIYYIFIAYLSGIFMAYITRTRLGRIILKYTENLLNKI